MFKIFEPVLLQGREFRDLLYLFLSGSSGLTLKLDRATCIFLCLGNRLHVIVIFSDKGHDHFVNLTGRHLYIVNLTQ